MNNFKNIFRIHHKELGYGPYAYFSYKKINKIELNEDEKELQSMLIDNEPWNKEWIKWNHLLDKVSNIEFCKKFGFISSFFIQRPGMWDDPIMKYNLRKMGYIRENLPNGIIKRFAFDSEEQLYNWFSFPEELSLLYNLGFVKTKCKEPLNKIIFGLKQCLILN